MMETARFFGMYPQKRSVLLLALTAEEVGVLGSSWYADHPLIPLKQTVFNFNCDGAGYNDTSIATVIGMERTTAEPEIAKACEAFGLKATVDPVPDQNLYERSDNYNFAKKGIPAIDFAPGTKAFDAELRTYYHQPADEVSSLDCGVKFKSLTEGVGTTTPAGRLLMHMIGSLAQFERDLIRERTRAGMEAVRARGKKFGAPTKLRLAEARELFMAGKSVQQVADHFGCSRSAVYNKFKFHEIEKLRDRGIKARTR